MTEKEKFLRLKTYNDIKIAGYDINYFGFRVLKKLPEEN